MIAGFCTNHGRVAIISGCTEKFACVDNELTDTLPGRRSFISLTGASLFGLVAAPSRSVASTTKEVSSGKIILNNAQPETAVVQDPISLVDGISTLYNQIESKYTQNGLVDYVSIEMDADFPKIVKEMAKLQFISLKDMDTSTKMAFVINLYNTLIKIAFVTAGIPKNDLTRLSFFDTVAINVGGDLFTFNDLENGLLRANSVPPYHLTKPFGKGDGRSNYALAKTDPRIHFALNCGAKSCPSVRRYTATGIEEELTAAANAFCGDDSNVVLDETKSELRVSKIFKWYSSDFASLKVEVPSQITKYLTGKKKESLEQFIQSGNISVDFVPYDWTTNASRSKTFG